MKFTRVAFDIETDGLLDTCSTVHVLSIRCVNTGEVRSYTGSRVRDGLKILEAAGQILVHNGIKFDIPALAKLYGLHIPPERVLDTLVLARLVWPTVGETLDPVLQRKRGLVMGRLWGSHSLEAWGMRLGVAKVGADIADWSRFTPEMLARCEADTLITVRLYERVMEQAPAEAAVALEHAVAWVCAQIERNGFKLDVPALEDLAQRLMVERAALREKLQRLFPPRVIERTSEKTGRRLKDRVIEFNPASRQQIAERLQELYGWEPEAFTDNGQPKVDETTLSALPYPEAQDLSTYFLLEKRLGQIAEGNQAWLKLVTPAGFIHGSINPNGTVTGRASHSHPNVAQVPSCRVPWGNECRKVWTVPDGWLLLGVDLKGLELRCLAHFLAPWDGGRFAEVVVSGDPHTHNQRVMGLSTRDQAKTAIYALIYGAGDLKLGSIAVPQGSEAQQVAEGRKIRQRVLDRLKGYRELTEALVNRMKGYVPVGPSMPPGTSAGRYRWIRDSSGCWWRSGAPKGCILGLDGRVLTPRSERAALNTLLQSAGALICKRWLVEVDLGVREAGLRMGWEGEVSICAWVHDELQIAVRCGHEATVGQIATRAARAAGEYFKFRCPIEADTPKIGKTWADTH